MANLVSRCRRRRFRRSTCLLLLRMVDGRRLRRRCSLNCLGVPLLLKVIPSLSSTLICYLLTLRYVRYRSCYSHMFSLFPGRDPLRQPRYPLVHDHNYPSKRYARLRDACRHPTVLFATTNISSILSSTTSALSFPLWRSSTPQPTPSGLTL